MTTSILPAPLNILIVGAGVCGPALALLLQRSNPHHNITVIERSPELRTGGQQIDLKAHGIPIMKRLGLLENIRSFCVEEGGSCLVDGKGNTLINFGVIGAGEKRGTYELTNEFEFMRGDFVRMMYDTSLSERTTLTSNGVTQGRLVYEFNTSINSLDCSSSTSTTVTFSTGVTKTYDLVIAADGQGSRTRRLAFGDDANAASFKSLNVHSAYYNIPRLPTEDSLARIHFASRNRIVMTRTGNLPVTQVLLWLLKDKERSARMRPIHRQPLADQKAAWTEECQDAGWDTPRFLAGLKDVDDFYATEIAQIKMPEGKITKNRLVLLGDAGYGPSPMTGMGTTLSLVGMYVLAGELASYPGHVDAAIKAYEETMKQPIEEGQKLSGVVDQLAMFPVSEWGAWTANTFIWTLSSFKVDKMLAWLAGWLPEGKKEDGWKLPVYPMLNVKAPKAG
ncbi:2-polyprenyl-6-methoxyphenol hydroxylase and related FAD-dependent oxidoreductase [Pyrenophora seminiperda CCB06]|uniref:2-polyprenyl-6-methoxyphenol hydroxylase and related FAD-dependent oxidoreductase n=1 Tax=Pyrenophora seminiperda CCB06 TaxID=1302712 RepID=A0A3M7M388_9PLEO|nr:2-polyprenyl-6-methoxyphenol hydroxylase and related FAD-dependent oxidoreductase [Pyrenophora seminiperda CCB06]